MTSAVDLTVSNIVFGDKSKGFTIVGVSGPGTTTGVHVDGAASAVTIGGNVVTGFGQGIHAEGPSGVVMHNKAFGNYVGIDAGPEGVLFYAE